MENDISCPPQSAKAFLIIIALVMSISFIMGLLCGNVYMQREAVKHGVGGYSPETQNFEWVVK